ncbi:S24 family peptidase [Paenibacillus sp. FSL R5-0407]|uniref:LexA family protein n=1 Tax=Paenibacillus sp. FSL R5-0407 TaxID=2975320 RepID=UPI0030F964E8
MSTGKRIKDLRLKRGLTQDQMADKLGMNRANFSNYERDVALPPGDTLADIATILNTSTDYLLGLTDNSNPNNTISLEMVQIPIYGEIRAGYNSLAQQDIIGYEIVAKDSVRDGDYFFLMVKGDSMIDEGIREGMRVLVRKQQTCQHGKIGVVLVDGEEGTLKRIFYDDDNVILQAANRDIPPRIIPIHDVIIQGQVVQVQFDV